jgi:hypothetical protein
VLVGGANVGARAWLGDITPWNTHKSHKALLLIMNIYDGSSTGGSQGNDFNGCTIWA